MKEAERKGGRMEGRKKERRKREREGGREKTRKKEKHMITT